MAWKVDQSASTKGGRDLAPTKKVACTRLFRYKYLQSNVLQFRIFEHASKNVPFPIWKCDTTPESSRVRYILAVAFLILPGGTKQVPCSNNLHWPMLFCDTKAFLLCYTGGLPITQRQCARGEDCLRVGTWRAGSSIATIPLSEKRGAKWFALRGIRAKYPGGG